MPEGVVNVAVLRDRLARVQVAKQDLIAQVNALLGREAELTELLALVEPSPESSGG